MITGNTHTRQDTATSPMWLRRAAVPPLCQPVAAECDRQPKRIGNDRKRRSDRDCLQCILNGGHQSPIPQRCCELASPGGAGRFRRFRGHSTYLTEKIRARCASDLCRPKW